MALLASAEPSPDSTVWSIKSAAKTGLDRLEHQICREDGGHLPRSVAWQAFLGLVGQGREAWRTFLRVVWHARLDGPFGNSGTWTRGLAGLFYATGT
jgi:hypothetical protein